MMFDDITWKDIVTALGGAIIASIIPLAALISSRIDAIKERKKQAKIALVLAETNNDELNLSELKLILLDKVTEIDTLKAELKETRNGDFLTNTTRKKVYSSLQNVRFEAFRLQEKITAKADCDYLEVVVIQLHKTINDLEADLP
jgi:hypothetical protein